MKDFSKYRKTKKLICLTSFQCDVEGEIEVFQKGNIYNVSMDDNDDTILYFFIEDVEFNSNDETDFSLIINNFATIDELIEIKELSDRREKISKI